MNMEEYSDETNLLLLRRLRAHLVFPFQLLQRRLVRLEVLFESLEVRRHSTFLLPKIAGKPVAVSTQLEHVKRTACPPLPSSRRICAPPFLTPLSTVTWRTASMRALVPRRHVAGCVLACTTLLWCIRWKSLSFLNLSHVPCARSAMACIFVSSCRRATTCARKEVFGEKPTHVFLEPNKSGRRRRRTYDEGASYLLRASLTRRATKH